MPPLLIINHTGLLRMPPRTGNPLRQLRVRLKLATCMVMPCAQLRRLRCPQTTIAPGSPRCQRVYARRENDPYRNLSATWNCRRLRPVMIAIQDLYLPMNICPGFPVGASTSAGSTSVCPFTARYQCRAWQPLPRQSHLSQQAQLVCLSGPGSCWPEACSALARLFSELRVSG